MSITSSHIIHQQDNGAGQISIHEQHFDHEGKVHEHRYRQPSGTRQSVIDDALSDWARKLPAILAEHNSSDALEGMKAGDDPADVEARSRHIDAAEITRTANAAVAELDAEISNLTARKDSLTTFVGGR